MNHQISQAAEQARESARTVGGQFGEQPKVDAGQLGLGGGLGTDGGRPGDNGYQWEPYANTTGDNSVGGEASYTHRWGPFSDGTWREVTETYYVTANAHIPDGFDYRNQSMDTEWAGVEFSYGDMLDLDTVEQLRRRRTDIETRAAAGDESAGQLLRSAPQIGFVVNSRMEARVFTDPDDPGSSVWEEYDYTDEVYPDDFDDLFAAECAAQSSAKAAKNMRVAYSPDRFGAEAGLAVDPIPDRHA